MCNSHTATNIPKLYKMLEFFGFETGAFSQLTQKYMRENFNPKTPDREGIAYYSYGATVNPRFWSMFRQSHRIIQKLEGDNDGLVSVQSSKWGTYKGTLKDVSHLDMINWTNRLRWFLWELTGNKRKYVLSYHVRLAWVASERLTLLVVASTPLPSTWTLLVSLWNIWNARKHLRILTLHRYVGERRTVILSISP
jgi:hypothetical protein